MGNVLNSPHSSIHAHSPSSVHAHSTAPPPIILTLSPVSTLRIAPSLSPSSSLSSLSPHLPADRRASHERQQSDPLISRHQLADVCAALHQRADGARQAVGLQHSLNDPCDGHRDQRGARRALPHHRVTARLQRKVEISSHVSTILAEGVGWR